MASPKLIDNGKYIIKATNSAGVFEHIYELNYEGRRVEPKKKRYFENVTIANVATPRVYPKPKPPKEPTPPPIVEPEVAPVATNEWEIQPEGNWLLSTSLNLTFKLLVSQPSEDEED